MTRSESRREPKVRKSRNRIRPIVAGRMMRQPLHGPLLVLELAAPGQEISRREADAAPDRPAGLGDEAAKVAAADIAFDPDPALSGLPADLARALQHGDVRHLAEGHAGPAGGRDEDGPDRFEEFRRGSG